MELQGLRYFVAAAEEGSFTKAATRLGVSQPTMSQSLRRLEQELGTPVFHRVGRGVVLSSAGELLLHSARKILFELDHAQQAIGALKGLARGRVSLAAPPGLTLDPGVQLIADFHRRHPGVVVSLEQSENGLSAMHAVASARCDVGLTDRAEAYAELQTLHIAEHELVLASPRGTFPRNEPVELLALHGLPMISTAPGTRSFALLQEIQAQGIQPRIVVESPHREATVSLILQGLGSSIMNRALAGAAEASGAEIYSFDPPQRYDVFLVHRTGRLTAAARAFLSHVAAALVTTPLHSIDDATKPIDASRKRVG